jgi:protein-tyrosine phosphatase
MTMARSYEFDGLLNVRDLGGLPTRSVATTPYRRVLRADAPTRASQRDRDALHALGVRVVVDLRTEAERTREPNALADDDRFIVHHVDLLGPVIAAFRAGAGNGDGVDPFDLRAQYEAIVRLARHEVASVLAIARDAVDDGVATLLHCTAGKDRTGVLSALLLAAAGVDADTIAEDYRLTDARIEPLRARLLDDAERHGMPREQYARLLTAEAPTILSVLPHFPSDLLALAAPILAHTTGPRPSAAGEPS